MEAIQCAVARGKGTVTLFETPAMGGGMSSLDRRYLDSQGIEVIAETLSESLAIDTVIESTAAERIRLLKLDCEGEELPILRALSPSARSRIDSIALEYHGSLYDLNLLADLLLEWDEFALSKPPEHEFRNNMIHLVRRDVIKRELALRAAN